jgi:hypothetical protein
MVFFKRAATSAAAISIFMTGSAAFADVTAQQVWADWKTYLESSGYAVEASEVQSGDTLNVTDVTMSIDIPEEDSALAMELGELTFTENGDGTVDVSLPSIMPIVAVFTGPDGDMVRTELEYTHTGLTMTASGSPEDMSYAYAAAEMGVRLVGVSGDEALGPFPDGTARMTIADIAGTTRVMVNTLRKTDQKMTSGPLSYDLDFEDPESPDARMIIKGKLGGTDFAATTSMPLEMDASDMAAAMAAGFSVDGKMMYRNGSSQFTLDEDGSVTEGRTSSESGEFDIAMSDDGLTYALTTTGMNLAMSGGDIPLPVELAMQETGFNLTVPVSKSDEEQDFELGLTLGDFTMSEMLWGMFDPGGQLPRDPATIALDLGGKVKLFYDLFDPEQMEAVESEGAIPGEVNALDINALTVRAAGAELTGEGAFTFDNTDLETFDGMPAPDGEVDLKLTGANGLLDTLIAMGLLPEDQAMGVRMMMGLFAVPGEGEDSLTSTIEVKSDGQILANGQRIK